MAWCYLAMWWYLSPSLHTSFSLAMRTLTTACGDLALDEANSQTLAMLASLNIMVVLACIIWQTPTLGRNSLVCVDLSDSVLGTELVPLRRSPLNVHST